MTSTINRVGNNPISPINNSPINSSSNFAGVGGASYHERFILPDDEKILDMGEEELQTATEERKHRDILIKLFKTVITDGIIIVPTPPRRSGDAIIEASLIQDPNGKKKPIMKIPLKGVENKSLSVKQTAIEGISLERLVTLYIEKILLKTSDSQIIKLLIVMAHEYGHFLSYLIGNHNRDLKVALNLFKMKQLGSREVNRYLWLIFREESSAWTFAQKTLSKYKFNNWKEFTAIKNNSLSSYSKLLKLEYANIDTVYKLSFLGEDFHSNFPSELFTQTKKPLKISTEGKLNAGN